ncbi:MAG: CDGSH-type Zn-finger protein [Planctomycetota bacterium]|jgi:CDGSH-type Zn-finger protein
MSYESYRLVTKQESCDMDNDEEPIIAVRENAFLRAAKIPILKDTDGSEIETKPVMALCRCGASANKPYCDGSHKKIDFDGTADDNTSRDRIYSYEGAEIDVHFSKLLCSHAAECGRLLSKVFDASQRPWIKPDNGTIDEIKTAVNACPSGALRYNLKGENPQQLDPTEVGMSIQKDGPYWVKNVPLEGSTTGPNGSGAKYVLCRCGLSRNKPYCDGSHRDKGWSDEDVI